MKKIVKMLAVVLAMACMGTALTGCGPASKDNSSSNAGSTNAPQKELVVATNAQFPPFEYVTQKGIVDKYDGIDIAIINEIAKKLNRKVVISNMDFGSVIPAIASGKADIAIAGMSVTPDRKDSIDFTDTYWIAMQTILVKKENTTTKNVDSLKGKTVGVVNAYTGDTALSKVEKSKNIKIKRYNTGSDAVQELKNGKLDAVVIDSPTADSFIKQNPELKGVSDNKFFSKEEYAMGVKKGNTELLNDVNKALKELKDSGRINQLAKEASDRLAKVE